MELQRDLHQTQSNAAKCEEVTKMLTNNERKTIERLAAMMQRMDEIPAALLFRLLWRVVSGVVLRRQRAAEYRAPERRQGTVHVPGF